MTFSFDQVSRYVVGIAPSIGNRILAGTTYVSSPSIFLTVDNQTAGLIAKLRKNGLDVIQVTIEIQVFRLYVQHDAVLRQIIHQRAVAFITFGNQVRAFAIPVSIRAQNGDLSAYIVTGALAALTHEVCRK